MTDNYRKPIIALQAILLWTLFLHVPFLAHAESYRVSAFSPISRGDMATAQGLALTEAREKAIMLALEKMVPEGAYQAFIPLFEGRILPKKERYITNYKIDYQDVSDLAYTVHLHVNVDTKELQRGLMELGVVKGPGSPPLAAVFVTVSLPANTEQVKVIGELADRAVSRILIENGVTVIPPGEDDFSFRVLRPPQEAEVLIGEGWKTRADLSIGVLFQLKGEAKWAGKNLTAPVTVSYQVLDVESGTLAGVASQDAVVVMDDETGRILDGDLNQALDALALSVISDIAPLYSRQERERNTTTIHIGGKISPTVLRELNYRMAGSLGEQTSLIPERYAPDGVSMTLLTDRTPEEVADWAGGLQLAGHPVEVQIQPERISITLPPGPEVPVGVREYGEEIPFYRRIPAPGIENPEDLRKVAVVPWQEEEDNGTIALANMAPPGDGILGRIDPSRDRDIFRYILPEGTEAVNVAVEQTGPGEVRPRVRVFDASGRLLKEGRARMRGRGLFLSLTVNRETDQIFLSLEDDLGRYVSKFPYVLSVEAVMSKGQEDEPS